jgi:hypothetical protein
MEPTFERMFGGKNAMRLTSACGTERTYRGKLAHVRFEEDCVAKVTAKNL